MNPVASPITAEIMSRLRRWREVKRWSCARLAEEITAVGFPVSRSVLANCENGRVKDVSAAFLVAAAKALDVDAGFLLPGSAFCPVCQDEPPAGFTCNTCERAS